MTIPIIDLFAGPGGLGEGFSALWDSKEKQTFKIALSIEKDITAHETLELRSFFRQFPRKSIPEDYYDHLRGKIDRKSLYALHPCEAKKAQRESWNAELGNQRKFPSEEVDRRIRAALDGADDWVLIGGPPCQAYSLVGRSRVIPVDPEKYQKDKRHFLYKEYLRIIAQHQPPVFVMENVKGILSAEVGGKPIIDRLLSDLRNPIPAVLGENGTHNGGLEYKIYPLVGYDGERDLFENGAQPNPADYIIKTEAHKLPQARHRFILLGVRSDITRRPGQLRVFAKSIKMWSAIEDLPRLRSRLSDREDSGTGWVDAIREIIDVRGMKGAKVDDQVYNALCKKLNKLSGNLTTGNQFLAWNRASNFQRKWFYDSRLGGVCNHGTRRHMHSDLWRYFFAACFAAVHKRSPRLHEFPPSLLPNHKNLVNTEDADFIFNDRFRVQVRSRPSTTITSHISKDGHYFIHPDPLQCRSLTVREAARLQTFPDNYFFAGPTTAQYQQVGNAVPPLIARQIAAIVARLF